MTRPLLPTQVVQLTTLRDERQTLEAEQKKLLADLERIEQMLTKNRNSTQFRARQFYVARNPQAEVAALLGITVQSLRWLTRGVKR